MTDYAAYQEAFLLDLFAGVEGGRLAKGKAKLPAAVAKALKLDAAGGAELLGRLAGGGLLAEARKGKSVSYAMTDAGRERLASLGAFRTMPPPELPPATHEDARLLGEQQAFLLLALFQSPGRASAGAALRRKAKAKGAKPLMIDDRTFAWVAAVLARDGRMKETKKPKGRSVDYELTAEGLRHLATAPQHEDLAITLGGRDFNELRAAAGRGSVGSGDEPVVVAEPTPPPQPVPLAPAQAAGALFLPQSEAPAEASDEQVMDECRELLREQFGHSGLVPIHVLRGRVASRFGPAAARHEVLDAQLRRLRREGRLRLVPISDRSTAGEQELADSIPGENELFFYVGNLQ